MNINDLTEKQLTSPRGNRFIDITGNVYGRLEVVNLAGKNDKGEMLWLCQCSCGNSHKVKGSNLRNGSTKSCGCLSDEIRKKGFNFKHGMKRTRSYTTWESMKSRCLNPNDKFWKDYGGRGITVCDKWMSFEGFYEDMGDKPEGMTIDRIDNNKGYSKENCQWATMKHQNRNKRDTLYLTCGGVTKCLAEWAEDTGIKYHTLYWRYTHGWPTDRCLEK